MVKGVNTLDVAVIGGGAAALFLAAGLGARATVLEGGDRVGRKILATGNGKCNLTGLHCTAEGYNNPSFVAPFLKAYSPQDAARDFNSMGLVTRVTADGRVYPYSESAASVLDTLMRAASGAGATLLTGKTVTVLRAQDGGFAIGVRTKDGAAEEYLANAVVLASGSNASNGRDSLSLFASLGHGVRPFVPSLVPIKTDKDDVKGLNGVRVKCAVTLRGTREEGEVLFREYGISGIAVLNLSALYARGQACVGDCITIDFAPDMTFDEVCAILQRGISPEVSLKGMFHSRVAERIARRANGAGVDATASLVKAYPLTLCGTLDASSAQVMSGGLSTAEFDDGLESLKVRGAYAIGEVLDIDGICGGYNLQWAWSSAAAVLRKFSAN